MTEAVKHFCVDIDNTIAQTDKVMRQVIADFTDGRVQLDYDDIVTFNYYECMDKQNNHITKEEWRHVHRLFSKPEYLMSLEPMPGAIEGLHRLSERGILHIATSRLCEARRTTIEWLESRNFPAHDLHFSRHGQKHVVMKGFEFAVEDDYAQAVAFSKISQTPCFLIQHPWNRDKDPIKNIQWVRDWSELIDGLPAFTATVHAND